MEIFRTAFEGHFTSEDCKKNIPYPFIVPTGTTRLRFDLSYQPATVEGIRNLITLTVFDPRGWRGECHRGGNHKQVIIAADQATPGFQAGLVTAGSWQAVLNTQMVMPGSFCEVHLEIVGLDDSIGEGPVTWKPRQTFSRGPGWYWGDLHAHSIHSDASWNIAGLAAYAREKNLDFVTLSDHNTVTGIPEMDAANSGDLLTICGMELTTFYGHALALGLRDWIDWRTCPGQRTMTEIAAEVTRRGGLYIIAHPMAEGDPKCTGCHWEYPEVMPGEARVVEVWNTTWEGDSNNEACLQLAYEWLNQGYRIAMTAGTDNHGGSAAQKEYGFNVVHAEDLSETAILQAVKTGRLYLSAGPVLHLAASAARGKAGLGDVLKVKARELVRASFQWQAVPSRARLEWILNGDSMQSWPISGSGTQTWEWEASQNGWGLVILRGSQGKMLALTNPIYFEIQP